MTQVSAVRDRKVTSTDGVPNPVTIDYPDLVESGDLLVWLQVNNATTVSSVAGWTLLHSEPVAGTGLQVWVRTADGSEAGSTFDFSLANSGRDTANQVWAIREDLNPGTPEADGATGTGGSMDPPSLSPSGGDRLYLWLIGAGMNGGTTDERIQTYPTETEGRVNRSNVAGISDGMGVAERLLAAATWDPGAIVYPGNQNWTAVTVAVPVDQPPAGAFPVVESTSQGDWGASAATQTLTLPSGVTAGDLLVATIAGNQDQTPTIPGWDLVDQAQDAGDQVRGTVLQRVADGTEGASVTVSFTTSSNGSYICRRISGADATKTEADSNTSSDFYMDWPTLTPSGGADDILWLADIAGNAQQALTGWPVNYGAVPLAQVGTGASNESASGGVLARNQATAEPILGKFNSIAPSVRFTVAIYTDGGPTPPPPSGGGNRMGGTGAIRKPPRTPR